jgi:hypothetical protein
MMKYFVMVMPMALVICSIGCDGGNSSTSYSPPSYSDSTTSDGYIDYNSSEFQDASEEVQQDVIIYNSLRDMGFSESDARDAVIDTID